MPENAEKWSCNKPIYQDKVGKNTKCSIACLHGHDVRKGKLLVFIFLSIWNSFIEKGRFFHRCKKGGIWHEPENVALNCNPNGKFLRDLS